MSAYKEMIAAIIDNAEKIIGYNLYFIDVMKPFARVYGEYSQYYQDYKFQKLTCCALYYGYKWKKKDAHSTLADVRAILYCYKVMAANNQIDT